MLRLSLVFYVFLARMAVGTLWALPIVMRMRPAEYPSGKVTAVTALATSEEPSLDVCISPPADGNEPVRCELVGLVVTEVLIRYCLESNIPIPRAGIKTVQIFEDSVSLEITLSDTDHCFLLW